MKPANVDRFVIVIVIGIGIGIGIVILFNLGKLLANMATLQGTQEITYIQTYNGDKNDRDI